MTRARTPALFGPPAETPACGVGTLCGDPGTETDPEPPADAEVYQSGVMPPPGSWLWAGLGLIGGYVLHGMLKKKR
jgi:hypothetical protein